MGLVLLVDVAKIARGCVGLWHSKTVALRQPYTFFGKRELGVSPREKRGFKHGGVVSGVGD